MRNLLAIFIMLLSGNVADAQTFGRASATDPYILTEAAAGRGFQDVGGRTQVNPTLVGGQKTAVIIAVGESTIANYDATNNLTCGTVDYTATNSTAQELDIYNGGIYQAKDPLLGNQSCGGSLLGRLADDLINASVFARVIVVPIAVGGVTMSEWATSGDLSNRISVALGRLVAAGLTSGTSLMAIVQDGANDNVQGTSQASWEASFNSMVSANPGIPFWFVAESTYDNGSASSTIQAAQAAVINGTTILAGPNLDSLTGTSCSASACRQASDNTHFTAAGSSSAASLWETAIAAKSW